jgi:hypothetical protein
VTTPTLVTDILLTDAFLIKGVVDPKTKRLSSHLDELRNHFVSVRDASLIDVRSRNVIQTPRILVNVERIVLAHEFLDTASDLFHKNLSANRRLTPIRVFHVGAVNFEVAGEARPGSYEVNDPTKRFFVIERPKIRGIDIRGEDDELAVLARLDYVIVSKSRLSYIYDFNE